MKISEDSRLADSQPCNAAEQRESVHLLDVSSTAFENLDPDFEVVAAVPRFAGPVLHPNILSIDTSQSATNATQWYATTSPGVSFSDDGVFTPGTDLTSPITPLQTNSEYWTLGPEYCWRTLPSHSAQMIDNVSRHDNDPESSHVWWPESRPYQEQWSDMRGTATCFVDFGRQDGNIVPPFTSGTANPVLSSGIALGALAHRAEATGVMGLMPTNQVSPIKGSLAFGVVKSYSPMLSSSPLTRMEAKSEPMTPVRVFGTAMSAFDTSPIPVVTPLVDLDRSDGDTDWTATDTKSANMHLEVATYQDTPSNVRSQRHRREQLRRRSKRSTPHVSAQSARKSSGIDCEPVIPQNTFRCDWPGCLNKLGFPNRFRRQEHKKRHEKTVHAGPDAPIYQCWACERPFTRNDNLKSHFKTHNKSSPARRNRYVATMDEDSPYYDPQYVGPLTDDGYPLKKGVEILRCSVKYCVQVFHKQDALKAHEMKKEHRRKESGRAALAKLSEGDDATFG